MAAVSDESPVGEACPFGWSDGAQSHVCKQVGLHTDHTCTYCGAEYVPSTRREPAAPAKR